MLSWLGMQIPEAEDYPPTDYLRKDILNAGSRIMLLMSAVSLLFALLMTMWFTAAPNKANVPYAPSISSSKQAEKTDPVQGHKPLVGIVSGHAGFDPGAVCADGLTEAEVNRQVADEVVRLLNSRGVRTDLLAEFDPALNGYKANALVSIHADSCEVSGMSGFKVARVTLSAIPEAEDKLVACLINEYSKITGLKEHSATITDGMTNYHAFREIASYTPGAIIETGFLLEDRALLERNPELVARGIASGILCFLKSDDE
jgi:N-acetylmuramoyl-L-alanine amidase